MHLGALGAMYRIWYTTRVPKKLLPSAGTADLSETATSQGKRVPAVFFRTAGGGEPVRDWSKALPSSEDRKRVGENINGGVRLAARDAGLQAVGRWYLRGTDELGAKSHCAGALLH